MRSKFLLAALAAWTLSACNNHENSESNTPPAADAYMQVTVSLPASNPTRGATGNDGSTAEGAEIGKDYENNITSLNVILEKDGTLLTFPANTGGVTSGSSFTTHPFPVTSITASTEYKVYVVANCGDAIASTDAARSITAVDLTGSIAKPNSFLMTNAKAAATITTGSDLTAYSKNTPLNAGTVEVERAVARFDYKSAVEDDVYELGDDATLTLKSLALINVNNKFHWFKRVSDDGTMTDAVLGGPETSSNYVVDAYYTAKMADPANCGSCYLSYLGGTTPYASATYTDISSLTTSDSAWSGTGADAGGGKYKVWTYCTENTIAPADNQLKGVTTGIVFKGELTGDKFDGTDRIYVFNNYVVGNWDDVWNSDDTDVQNALAAAGDDLGEIEDDNAVADLAAAGFTRYSPDAEGKYYAFYVYWNRHNDNGVETVMGPMEFAVVRNNVYKLAVTAINRFGHPEDPTVDPDPDPETPDDPDEDDSMYMKVAVEILPWTVRVNDIEFL